MAHSKRVGAQRAAGNYCFGISHAASCSGTGAERKPTITNASPLSAFFPTPEKFLRLQVAKRLALFAQRRLGLGKAIAKPLARYPQGIFWVDLHPPRQGDHREEQVAHLLEDLLRVACCCQLACFFRDRLGRLLLRGEIESHTRGSLLQAQRPRESGQR